MSKTEFMDSLRDLEQEASTNVATAILTASTSQKFWEKTRSEMGLLIRLLERLDDTD